MRIASADIITSCPGRNYVTFKLTTDDGIIGLGDATLNGRELAVVAYLKEHVAPLLIGRDAHSIEDTWQYLYRGAYWRRGPVTMATIAAVDTALWDIKAKSAGLPLYQLLGGACRRSIRAYGHATGRDLPELLQSVAARRAEGFTAMRIQSGLPGLSRTYGTLAVGAGNGAYEPAQPGDLPDEEPWDSSTYLRHMPEIFAAVRAEVGPGIELLHDVHNRLTPNEAARLGKALEPYDPYWVEDPTPAENPAVIRAMRQHTSVPIALGETFNTVWDYRTLIEEQLIDFVRSSVTHAGGLTSLKKLIEYAAQFQIRSAFHGPSDISPVGLAAALHLDMAIHNFGIQEYMPHPPEASSVFESDYRFADGAFVLGDAPGLGVTLIEDAASRFPYRRAYLPVARNLDGTMHDW